MEPCYINRHAYIWLEFILILAANLGVTFALLFINSPNLKKLVHPIFVSLFVTITTFHREIDLGSIFYLFFFTLIFSFIPESNNKSSEGRDISEQENDTIENNDDNQAADSQNESNDDENNQAKANDTEANQAGTNQENQGNNSEGDKQSFFDKLNCVNLTTAFFVLFAWFQSIDQGMNDQNKYIYNANEYFRNDDNLFIKYNIFHYVLFMNGTKVLINLLFYHLFLNATYQFFYATLVLNDDPPRWLYLFYMIPLSVFYPLSSLLSFYVSQFQEWTFFTYVPYGTMLNALYLYFSFKLLNQFVQECINEGEFKNKIINVALYAVGFLWLVFVQGIFTMNASFSYD